MVWSLMSTCLLGLVPFVPEAGDLPMAPRDQVPAIRWHDDYAEAYREAERDNRMLLIYFHHEESHDAQQRFERDVLKDREIQQDLKDYVLAKLPLSASAKVEGDEVVLLRHSSFREMLGQPGIAVVDLKHTDSRLHGQVVSTFPFSHGRYYGRDRMRVVLNLPKGTLTQRTLIFAVRVHPERPASTEGDVSSVLAEEAQSHSVHQASIQLQGHHNWENRFHSINGRLPGGLIAQEVVAESWPGENLVEAAEECVHSWRQSSGHWSAVRGRHRLFGYDMKRGRNGIWYATGIFARFR